MPIGGLVISLVEDQDAAAEALRMLAVQADIDLGEAAGGAEGRLPAVLDSPTAEHSESRVRELCAHAGIFHIDVVYVGFDEDDAVPDNPFDRPRRKRRGNTP